MTGPMLQSTVEMTSLYDDDDSFAIIHTAYSGMKCPSLSFSRVQHIVWLICEPRTKQTMTHQSRVTNQIVRGLADGVDADQFQIYVHTTFGRLYQLIFIYSFHGK